MTNAVLFYSNTKVDKNLKYLVKCNVEDDFCLIKTDKHTIALISALEINRLKKESAIDTILPLEEFRINSSDKVACLDRFIQHILSTHKITVSKNFPFGIASELIKRGYSLQPSSFSILPERVLKSDTEVAIIGHILVSVGKCFEHIRTILADSDVSKSGQLVHNGSVLTSEYLRSAIEQFCYHHGLISDGTIVACGKQSSDPHCQGFGPIYANEFIVIDLFPYEKSSGYYADITRTFLKGRPSGEQTKMYNTVRDVQKLCADRLIPGADAQKLMAMVLTFFENEGYHTDRSAQVPYGMFHSLGHGFGLDIHEYPSLSNKKYILCPQNVITLEPGLYYPNIGGVRIEDDFLVTESQAAKLSDKIGYDWIID